MCGITYGRTSPNTAIHFIFNIQSHKPCSRKFNSLGVKRDEISNIIQTERLYLVTYVYVNQKASKGKRYGRVQREEREIDKYCNHSVIP